MLSETGIRRSGLILSGDPLSGLFHLIIAVISFLVVIYSLTYMKRYTAGTKFYSLLMLMIAGMNGVVASW